MTPLLSASSVAQDSPSNNIHLFSANAAISEIIRHGEFAAAPALNDLEGLRQESDPELFFEGLLHWARRQECRDPASALAVLQFLESRAEAPDSVRTRAARRLAAHRGEGGLGERAELFFRDTFEQTLSPANLLAMAGAGLAFRTSRLAFLGLMGRSGLGGGLGRAAASGLAFHLEATSFPILQRTFRQIGGADVDWSPAALRRDIYASHLFLGGLRLSGVATSRFLASSQPRGLGFRLSQSGAMLTGVTVGHYLEHAAGLRHFDSPADLMAASLASFFQFQVAGSVLRRGLGPRFETLERHLDRAAAQTSFAFSNFGPRPALANATGPLMSTMLELPTPANGTHRPVIPGFEGPSRTVVEPVVPAPAAEAPPIQNHFELIEALVQQRGNLRAAAEQLKVPEAELRQRLRSVNHYSELSVFPADNGGRMLFYTPALSRARHALGARILNEGSLAELGLSPSAAEFAQRLGVSSIWDLLTLTRADIRGALRANEPPALAEQHRQEWTRAIDLRLSPDPERVLPNFPFEEGALKASLGRHFENRPISDLGLAPATESALRGEGLNTLDKLLARPIPRWIPRESVEAGSLVGIREARVDDIVRSLYALMNGSGPRSYRPPLPDIRPPETPVDLSPLPTPRLKGVTEGDLLRRLVATRGNVAEAAVGLGRSPREIAQFLDGHHADSELSAFQAGTKGTMIFYSPTYRLAASQLGSDFHSSTGLSRLGLASTTLQSLAALGVRTPSDLLLLTRSDLVIHLGSEGARILQDELRGPVHARLNQDGLQRNHVLFRRGILKEALAETYGDVSVGELSLAPATRELLQARGLTKVRDLMARPIPEWIADEQLGEAHPSVRAQHLDATIRSLYVLLGLNR